MGKISIRDKKGINTKSSGAAKLLSKANKKDKVMKRDKTENKIDKAETQKSMKESSKDTPPPPPPPLDQFGEAEFTAVYMEVEENGEGTEKMDNLQKEEKSLEIEESKQMDELNSDSEVHKLVSNNEDRKDESGGETEKKEPEERKLEPITSATLLRMEQKGNTSSEEEIRQDKKKNEKNSSSISIVQKVRSPAPTKIQVDSKLLSDRLSNGF